MRKTFSMIVALVIALTALTSVPVARGAGEAVAPQVIDSAPAPGAELAPDGAVTFYFDQPMDQASVQAALKTNPLIPGNLSWTNDSTVSFKPNSPLARGNQYTFTIGSGAKSKAGLPMRDTYSLRLRTAGALEVTQVFPANGAVNIEATPTITVIFSRPVVPLGTAEEMAKLPSPLAIAPGVDGKGEWTSTSIYTFKPSMALAGGKKYTVIVGKGLTDVTGSTLPNDVTFSFSVAVPQAIEIKLVRNDASYVDPNNADKNVPREPKVSVTFSQPMDQASTEKAFTLTKGSSKVDGTLTWNDLHTVLTFTPKNLLDYGTTYIARVAADTARSLGGAALNKDAQTAFTTVGLPDIVNTNPGNNSATESYGNFNLQFAGPMKLDTMKDRISIDPKPNTATADEAFIDPNGVYYTSGFGLNPGTPYTVTIDVNGLTDSYGTPFSPNPQNKAYSIVGPGKLQIKFATSSLRPAVNLEFPGNPGMYSAYRPATQLFTSHVNVGSVDLALYSLPLIDFLNLARQNSYEFQRTYNPSTLLRSWSAPVTNPPNRVHYDLLTISTQGPGGAAPQTTLSCPGAPATQIQVGMTVVVLPDDPTPLRVRSAPGLTGPIVTQVKPGGQFIVIGGPKCLDNYVWWNVKSLDGAIVGWAAEGTLSNYFIGPVGPQQPTPTLPSDTGAASGPLVPGMYWLSYGSSAVTDQSRQQHIMLVSTAAVTVKLAPKAALAWVTDLQSGQPIPNATIQFYAGQPVLPLGVAVKTDANGLARLNFDAALKPDRDEVLAVLSDGKNFGVGDSAWNNGLAPYNFNQQAAYDIQSVTVYVYTDRSIYQPGQSVYFRGVLRNRDDVTYGLSGLKTVSVEVVSESGESIFTKQVAVDDFGSFADSFTLDANAALGNFIINVRPGTPVTGAANDDRPVFSRTINVAQYHLPEFQVKVTPDQAQVIQGDMIKVTVDSAYFFGGPVKNTAVEWLVMSDNYRFNYTGSGNFNFQDFNDDGYVDQSSSNFEPTSAFRGNVANGTGKTDDQGKFSIQFPADLGKVKDSQQFTIEARVTDSTDQVIAGTAQVVVHRGEFYIGVAPENYVGVAGQPQKVNLLSVALDSAPRPNTDISIRVVQRVWASKQAPDPRTGQLIWKSTLTENKIAEDVVHTDGDGKASYSFTPPQGGIYKVYAIGRDSRGNQFSSAAYVWVSGPGTIPWRQSNANQIDLKTDRTSYKAGDKATILIPTTFQGEAKALVTVERGKVLKSEVVTISSNSTVYTLPITADMAPNAYISVLVVKGVDQTNPVASYRAGLAQFGVDTSQLKLNIAVTPDKPQAGPGDTINYKLKVTDYQGKPVQAEVGVGLTDLAALSVAPDTSEPILTHFYGKQNLGVSTGSGLANNVDERTAQIAAELAALNNLGATAGAGGRGGGGGGEGGPTSVRQKFVDTPLWSPSVKTDANGEAIVTVTLPDNLTQWRLDARAATLPMGELNTTLVGQTTFDLLSTKPLLVRPVTPHFFVSGDTSTLAAVVNNNTGADQLVTVRLDIKGALLKGEPNQSASVAAGSQRRFEWQIEVQEGIKVGVTFTAATADGKYTDAAVSQAGQGDDHSLPVLSYQAPETTGTGGVIGKEGGTRTEGVSLPERLSNTPGTLNVSLQPSMASSAASALKVLSTNGLDSTEGTVSRFLPNLMAYRALKQLKMDNPTLKAELDNAINFAVQKLESEQHKDGGWGWFVADNSNGLVSAYVLIGLSEARKEGVAVDPGTFSRAIVFVQRALAGNIRPDNTNSQLNQQAFLVYALARAGAPDLTQVVRLLTGREKLNLYARAYIALALHITDPQNKAADALISDFQSRAISTGSGVHWQEDTQDDVNWNTDTRTTAIILETLLELQPTNALIPTVVRWLMAARRGDAWESTQETAWAVMALTNYMQLTGELAANYSFDVKLNDLSLFAGQTGPQGTGQQELTFQVPIKNLQAGQTNILKINRTSGDGTLSYTAYLNSNLPADQIKALSRGLSLTRTYSLMADANHTPITQAKVGDTIRVVLTINVPQDLNYVVISDPIPAGTEAVDPDLATTGTIGTPPELKLADPLAQGFGWWWFSHTELRSEKTVLFATFLPKGTYQYTYTLQATLAGQYHVIPATGQEQYFPEVYGRSDGALFTLLPK